MIKKILYTLFTPAALALIISCAGTQVPEAEKTGNSDTDALSGHLHSFFRTCDLDIVKAAAVVRGNDLEKMLSHFLSMDKGGKKYYQLERESIYKMICSVTEGVYSDLLIINSSGRIVFSAGNHFFFGKYIKSIPEESTISKLFNSGNPGVEYHDYSVFFPDQQKKLLAFSAKINDTPDSARIMLIVEPEIIFQKDASRLHVTSLEGECRKISESCREASESPLFSRLSTGSGVTAVPFSHREISWLILEEN